MKQVDTNNTGLIKLDVFRKLLNLHKIILSDLSFTKLCECSQAKSGLINYKVALGRLTVDLEVDEPIMKEWIVRTGPSKERTRS